MENEELKNFIDFVTNLVKKKWYGKLEVKIDKGNINIAEKIDKIKFDKRSYSEYKSNNK